MKKMIILSLTLLANSVFANDDIGEYILKRMIILNAFAQVDLCHKYAQAGYMFVENKERLDRIKLTKEELNEHLEMVNLVEEAKNTKLSAFDFYNMKFAKCLADAKKKMEEL